MKTLGVCHCILHTRKAESSVLKFDTEATEKK